MDQKCFSYHGGILAAEQVSLIDIAAEYGTPCYVYSRAAIEQQWRALDAAFNNHPHSICYAVKANSNLAVLNVLARLGSGFDIVSRGELNRVLLAGGEPEKIVYSGVAKSTSELRFAIQNKIRCINIESVAELERVQIVARETDSKVNIALRVNPDVDAQTHPYIATGLEQSKFGISMADALKVYKYAATMPHINIYSIACHIGSQITTLGPFKDAVSRLAILVNQLSSIGIRLSQIDLGGGLGIDYNGEDLPSATEYIAKLMDELRANNISLPIAIEPGRYIAGNAGVLLTRVEYIKSNTKKNFVVVDAGMNDILRPSLYQAYHKIAAVKETSVIDAPLVDVVGPVCESSDVLAYDRRLMAEAGDLLAVCSAGAYGFSMASNYNSRPRPAEIMVDGADAFLIRRRETIAELTQAESMLPQKS